MRRPEPSLAAPALRRPMTVVVALVVALVAVGACSGTDDVTAPSLHAGDGSVVETAEPPGPLATDPGTTALPATTLPPDTYEIATAKACEIEVVLVKGTGPSGSPICNGTPPPTQPKVQEPVATGNGAVSGLPAIPRDGLNSAGVRRTAIGWAYTNPTYFKGPVTFLVTAREGDWLKVLVPARPNRAEGWVRAADVTLTSTDYHVTLTLGDYHLVVTKGGDVIVDTKVVIGTPGTPTPVGRFYVNDKIAQTNPYGSYGPWILSTSGYSEALDTFDGGLPVIGFHGTNLPGLIGSQSSNGCVRMANDVVTKLATELPVGTPIDIVA